MMASADNLLRSPRSDIGSGRSVFLLCNAAPAHVGVTFELTVPAATGIRVG